ncbi:hypothetical protein L195_g037232, partial [Trifolium pratense]
MFSIAESKKSDIQLTYGATILHKMAISVFQKPSPKTAMALPWTIFDTTDIEQQTPLETNRTTAKLNVNNSVSGIASYLMGLHDPA